MNFTQEQISELLLEIANSENGSNLLMQLTLNAFMKSGVMDIFNGFF